MKRILVLGQTDNPGGVEAVIKRYYEALKQEIQMDLIVTSDICYDEAYYRANQSRIYFVKNAQFRHPLAYKKEIRIFFESNRGVYDAIWYNCCDLANCGYIMKQAKRVGIKKRIIHAHNNQLIHTGKKRYFYAWMHNYWKNHIDQYATDFWACSESAGDFFYKQAILESDKFRIINNAIEIEKFSRNNKIRKKIREELHISDDCLAIGHVGRFQYQKNHEFLIKVFNGFHMKHQNSCLLLVGQGVEEDKIRNQVKSMQLEEYVHFLGIRDNVNEVLQAMDVFVLPSRFEGLGIVLVEAQAVGLPCVTSKDVVPEVVNVTGNVAFTSLNAPINEWVEVIERQLNKDINFGDVKKKLVQAGYDMNTEGKKFLQLIED